MKENLKDILSNLNPEVDQEALLKYLEGKLSAEEQHEVEKNTMDNAFDTDAIEGLQGFQDKKQIASLIEQLNRDLKKKTAKKKKWVHRREAKLEPWLLITILLILAIAVISFFIIRKMKGQ